jgi:hypothetical protein
MVLGSHYFRPTIFSNNYHKFRGPTMRVLSWSLAILILCSVVVRVLGFVSSSSSGSSSTTRSQCDATNSDLPYVVPNIVHQIYDYQSPNFFMYLSLMCVQRYLKPKHHYLWVNDAGRFRRGDWHNWQNNAEPGSWKADLAALIKNNTIEPMLKPFSMSPPGNSSLYATNKAHISDFVRLDALKEYGKLTSVFQPLWHAFIAVWTIQVEYILTQMLFRYDRWTPYEFIISRYRMTTSSTLTKQHQSGSVMECSYPPLRQPSLLNGRQRMPSLIRFRGT